LSSLWFFILRCLKKYEEEKTEERENDYVGYYSKLLKGFIVLAQPATKEQSVRVSRRESYPSYHPLISIFSSTPTNSEVYNIVMKVLIYGSVVHCHISFSIIYYYILTSHHESTDFNIVYSVTFTCATTVVLTYLILTPFTIIRLKRAKVKVLNQYHQIHRALKLNKPKILVLVLLSVALTTFNITLTVFSIIYGIEIETSRSIDVVATFAIAFAIDSLLLEFVAIAVAVFEHNMGLRFFRFLFQMRGFNYWIKERKDLMRTESTTKIPNITAFASLRTLTNHEAPKATNLPIDQMELFADDSIAFEHFIVERQELVRKQSMMNTNRFR
jgi:hypothetical protein